MLLNGRYPEGAIVLNFELNADGVCISIIYYSTTLFYSLLGFP